LPNIDNGEELSKKVTLLSPSLPSAYEIKMKIFDESRVYSIYSNRMIVTGPTSKIRKIYLDGIGQGQYSINSFIAGSPDHFTIPSPVFTDFSVITQIFDNNNLLNTYSKDLTEIKTGEIKFLDLNINETKFDKVCQKIVKNDLVYDQECFNVPLDILEEEFERRFGKSIDVNYKYDFLNESLFISLNKHKSINGQLFIFNLDGLLFEENLSDILNFEKTYPIKKSNLTLVVDDFDLKKQTIYKLNLADELDLNPVNELNSCSGQICKEGLSCSRETFNSIEGECCPGDCINLVSGETNKSNMVPFILILSIVFLIISILILNGLIKRSSK
jgi:hypothetical protein